MADVRAHARLLGPRADRPRDRPGLPARPYIYLSYAYDAGQPLEERLPDTAWRDRRGLRHPGRIFAGQREHHRPRTRARGGLLPASSAGDFVGGLCWAWTARSTRARGTAPADSPTTAHARPTPDNPCGDPPRRGRLDPQPGPAERAATRSRLDGHGASGSTPNGRWPAPRPRRPERESSSPTACATRSGSRPARHQRVWAGRRRLERLGGDQPHRQPGGVRENFGWPCYEGAAAGRLRRRSTSASASRLYAGRGAPRRRTTPTTTPPRSCRARAARPAAPRSPGSPSTTAAPSRPLRRRAVLRRLRAPLHLGDVPGADGARPGRASVRRPARRASTSRSARAATSSTSTSPAARSGASARRRQPGPDRGRDAPRRPRRRSAHGHVRRPRLDRPRRRRPRVRLGPRRRRRVRRRRRQAVVDAPYGGHVTVRLRVTDPSGLSDVASRCSSSAASAGATIAAPVAGTTWRVGVRLAFSGSARLAQKGAAAGGGLTGG